MTRRFELNHTRAEHDHLALQGGIDHEHTFGSTKTDLEGATDGLAEDGGHLEG